MVQTSGKGATSKVSQLSPYFADVGVIGLPPEAWGGPWMSRHHVLTRLATYFNVIWCNPALDWRRARQRRTLPSQVIHHGTTFTPGFTIYDPGKWLPRFYRPYFLARLTERQRLSRAQRFLHKQGCRKLVLSLWSPQQEPALNMINHDLSCYHIDDEYTFSEIEQPIEECEASLILRVNQTFIHSPALLEKKGNLNSHTLYVPNGVDYRAYVTPHCEPTDLRPIPHPRVGYVGYIKKQLDIALLVNLAQRHQKWSFVFVGPQGNLGENFTLVQKLSRMPNVYFLGEKPVSALPAYTQHLDVCLLCYERNDYTKFICPLKLHEYLASGCPVVGSPIRTLLDFAHVITLAQTLDEWSQALADALAPSACSAEQIEVRRRVARKYDWDDLVCLIAQTICERLGTSYSERFEQLR
jgi:glycosyltransferase involved in cell wall biosynthesis